MMSRATQEALRDDEKSDARVTASRCNHIICLRSQLASVEETNTCSVALSNNPITVLPECT